ncbi:unnamed protein product, partial [Ectocarpus sp. 12 AP-2014]
MDVHSTGTAGPRAGEIWSCFSGSGNETVLGICMGHGTCGGGCKVSWGLVWVGEGGGGGGACGGAAPGGHLDIVTGASRNGCQWDKRTCDLAAQGGHLHVLKWAIKHGCVWD